MTTQMTTKQEAKQNAITQLLEREYNGFKFMFREDAYFNMTRAAKYFGKRLDHFLFSEDTKEYISALEQALSSNPRNSVIRKVVEVKRGNGQLPQVGSWAHPKFAVFFARWLDPKFAVWCDMMIDDILNKKAEVTIVKPEESMVSNLPMSFLDTARHLVAALEKQEEMKEKIAELETTIDNQQEDVVFVQNYVEADGLHTFRQVAKMLDVRESTLREMMVEQGIQYKLNKLWMPKQTFINQGYFVVKAYVDPHGQSFPQVYYTSRGVNWLAKRLNKWLDLESV